MRRMPRQYRNVLLMGDALVASLGYFGLTIIIAITDSSEVRNTTISGLCALLNSIKAILSFPSRCSVVPKHGHRISVCIASKVKNFLALEV